MNVRVLALAFISIAAFGVRANAACRLSQPIPLQGREFWKTDANLSGPVQIESAVFDQPIQSEAMDPRYRTSPMVAELFSVVYLGSTGERTVYGWPGANIRPDVCGLPWGCASGAGFSYGFAGGAPDVAGALVLSGTQTRYETTLNSNFASGQTATNRFVAEVENGALTSLELTMPIYTRTEQDKVVYLHFTGHHQTLCLLSGRLRQ